MLGGVEGFVNPTRVIHCSSAYGNRIHPVHGTQKFHSGLDIGIAGGEPIYAAKDGTVSVAVTNVNSINNCNYGYGNYIKIDHGDGTSTLYAHIKYGTIPSSITVGSEVSQGEQIGQVGSTGCSTGNHLHYEVRVNGQTADPADYIDLTGSTGSCKR
jgi:murein DD-endopeptidase MepM/ murein hydrolase activator NlpD